MKSILQNEKECLVCGSTQGLELHHCIYGSANRKLSDKYGLVVWLCKTHHTSSNESVHFNKVLDRKLKKFAQERYEAVYGDNFLEVFGRNYK